MSNTNSQFQLKTLNDKSAKALASSASKFLAAKGIQLPHSAALDLAGTLCGFADWQGLRAAIVEAEKANAGVPIRMDFDEFVLKFKPIKNPFDDNAVADGLAFETSGEELAAVLKAHETNPDTVWTCVDNDGVIEIINGYHYVNRQFFFITKKPAKANTGYEVAYSYDLSDSRFEVSVVNLDNNEETFVETRFGSGTREILEWARDACQDEVEVINGEGGTAAIVITQVSPN